MNTTRIPVAIGDSWNPKALSYLAMLMMALMLITNVLNLKFINFFGLSVIGSQLSFVLSLILGDILTEVYGYKRVRRTLWAGIACLILYATFVQVIVLLPPAVGYANNDAFVTLFAAAPRIVCASIIAYFVTELTNSSIMSRMKICSRGKNFYGRALFSTAAAQLADVVVFYGIAFLGVLPLSVIVSASAVSWIAVIICEIVILPLTHRAALALKKYEQIEHFDAEPT